MLIIFKMEMSFVSICSGKMTWMVYMESFLDTFVIPIFQPIAFPALLCTAGLDVPIMVPNAVEGESDCDLCLWHSILEVLLVGKQKE